MGRRVPQRGRQAWPAGCAERDFPEHGERRRRRPVGRDQGRVGQLSAARHAAHGGDAQCAGRTDARGSGAGLGVARRAPGRRARGHGGNGAARRRRGAGHVGRPHARSRPRHQLSFLCAAPADEPRRPAGDGTDPAGQPRQLPPASGRRKPRRRRLPALGREPAGARRAPRKHGQRAPRSAQPARPRATLPAAGGAADRDPRRRGDGPGRRPLRASPSRRLRRAALPRRQRSATAGDLRRRVLRLRPGGYDARLHRRLLRATRTARPARRTDRADAAGAGRAALAAGFRRRQPARCRLRPAAAVALEARVDAAGAAPRMGRRGAGVVRRLRRRRGAAGDADVLDGGRRPPWRRRAGGLRRRRAAVRRRGAADPGVGAPRARRRRLALRRRQPVAALARDAGADGGAWARHHDAAVAHRGTRRPAGKLALQDAAGRTQPLRHQRPARAASGRRRLPRRARRGEAAARTDGARPPRRPQRQAGRSAGLFRRARAAPRRARVQSVVGGATAGGQCGCGRALVR